MSTPHWSCSGVVLSRVVCTGVLILAHRSIKRMMIYRKERVIVGNIRNGARTVLNLLQKCCKLSHLPGFRGGVTSILGGDTATEFFLLWDPFCAFIDVLVASDNWFNQIDYNLEIATSEDIGPVL